MIPRVTPEGLREWMKRLLRDEHQADIRNAPWTEMDDRVLDGLLRRIGPPPSPDREAVRAEAIEECARVGEEGARSERAFARAYPQDSQASRDKRIVAAQALDTMVFRIRALATTPAPPSLVEEIVRELRERSVVLATAYQEGENDHGWSLSHELDEQADRIAARWGGR